MELTGHCHGCLCRVPSDSELPLCSTCYDELLGLPINKRIEACSTMIRSHAGAVTVERFFQLLDDYSKGEGGSCRKF